MESAREAFWNERNGDWEAFIRIRGVRYADCQLQNIEVLQQYQQHLEKALFKGVNLLLYGPVGTGKDHAVAAIARTAIKDHGFSCVWWNGVAMSTELRGNSFENEARIIKEASGCQILWISDPIPPKGLTSDHLSRCLYQIIDARYSRCLPTWVTMNARSKEDAENHLGAANLSRLKDGAVVVLLKTEDHRKPKKVEEVRV